MIYDEIRIENGEYIHIRDGVEIERRLATEIEMAPPENPET